MIRIPKGFRPKARGCDLSRRNRMKAEERATLGEHVQFSPQPQRPTGLRPAPLRWTAHVFHSPPSPLFPPRSFPALPFAICTSVGSSLKNFLNRHLDLLCRLLPPENAL